MGELTVLGHCTFAWREPVDPRRGPRVYELEPRHCARCIEELKRMGAQLIANSSQS